MLSLGLTRAVELLRCDFGDRRLLQITFSSSHHACIESFHSTSTTSCAAQNHSNPSSLHSAQTMLLNSPCPCRISFLRRRPGPPHQLRKIQVPHPLSRH